MFQYAAGKSLADRLKTHLYLDLSWYKQHRFHDTPRKYELTVFAIPDAKVTLPLRLRFTIARIISRVSPLLSYKVGYWFTEKSLNYDSRFEKLKGDIYLQGFWPSEKYFKSIEPTIRSTFIFPPKVSSSTLQLQEEMRSCHSVAVHFRRGDYETNEKTKAYHGVTPLSYYADAMKFIGRRMVRPVYYYFSDDTDWLKAQMPPTTSHKIIDLPQEPDWVQMKLISECKHAIIANSTFSWWGAWLNPNPNKIVISPKQWFNDPTKETHDLIPEGWVRL